jgi:hypothetical protein
MIFILLYHLMFFTTEHIHLVNVRYWVGISLISFTLLLLMVNLALIVIPTIKL